ncbi:MAG TPA: hypothetical protein V6C81_31930 [Planktothrix sp.]|jgi:hypothetical protein
MYLVTLNNTPSYPGRPAFYVACRNLLIFVLMSCMMLAAPVKAETGGWDYERIMVKQYDYVFYCDMEVVENFMSYKGSKMPGPYVRFMINYQRTNSMNRMADQSSLPAPVKYEEIWYHAGKCVGLHRFNQLYLNQNLQGGIYFRGVGDDTLVNHTLDMANCAIRLLMDIYAQRSIMAGVLVPLSCYEPLTSDFNQFNFFRMDQSSGGKGDNMTVRLEAYPRTNTERYFYYDDTGRNGH